MNKDLENKHGINPFLHFYTSSTLEEQLVVHDKKLSDEKTISITESKTLYICMMNIINDNAAKVAEFLFEKSMLSSFSQMTHFSGLQAGILQYTATIEKYWDTLKLENSLRSNLLNSLKALTPNLHVLLVLQLVESL